MYLLTRFALGRSGLERLDLRRKNLVRDTFQFVREPGHILYDLLLKSVLGEPRGTSI